MKIVFLCGELEPGKNGVGDYVHRFAQQLLKEGISVFSIALNDRFINNKVFEKEKHDHRFYRKLRLGRNISLSKRLAFAEDWLNEIDPEWLSLQYVPYSFHKKGLPLLLNKKLKDLGRGRRWHIMFHELWVGMGFRKSLKAQIYGVLQKFIIEDLLKSLDATRIHTHTTVYKRELELRGWEVSQLPLFANIKFCKVEKRPIPGKLRIAVFGTIQPEAKLYDFVSWLKDQDLKDICFHFIGKNGKERDRWLQILDENAIDYKVFGWLEEKAISQELYNCDLGLTSTPYYLVEKSGTVSAMIKHNMKIICIGPSWIPGNFEMENIQMPVARFVDNLTLENIEFSAAYAEKISIENVTEKFLADLQIHPENTYKTID